jgi:hypothetical protein
MSILAGPEARATEPRPRKRATPEQRAKAHFYPKEIDFLGGSGEWASVSYCDGTVSVVLHETRGAAKAALKQISAIGCCGQCRGLHRLTHIAEETEG